MANGSIASLLTLPVELHYRILDYLDTQDILCSFRNVCRDFYTITNTYNRYKIRVTSTSRNADIYRLCRLIQPENVLSCALTITNHPSDNMSDRIQLFLSLIDVHQFTRLRYLDLFVHGQSDFNKIMHYACSVPTLLVLSLHWQTGEAMSCEVVDLLSSIIVTSNLRKLHLRFISSRMYTTPNLNHSKLEELTIDCCTHKQLFDILQHLPNLRVFSSNYYSIDETSPIVFSGSFEQLTSLSLRSPYMHIGHLESLLSVTPSLAYLHIANHSATFNFLQRLSQWEQFICQNLLLLRTFKFYTYIHDYDYTNVRDLETVLHSFRTSFWLENKHCYVTCKYINNDIRCGLMVYSSAASESDFPDNLYPGILSYSTSTTENDDGTSMSSTWNARLNLSEMTDALSAHKLNQPTGHIFQHITQLALDINWLIDSFDLLTDLFDLSQLTEICLFLSDHHFFEANTLYILLSLASNVRTLEISYDNDSTTISEEICSVLSRHIKHLKVRTIDLDCMQLVLACAENLSSVTFIRNRTSSSAWADMIEWLTTSGRKFTQSHNYKSLQVWLDTTDDELLENITDH